eukprot:5583823-Pleurochrysis_carterae.AAC.2
MQEEEHALQAALQASRQEAAQAQSRAATSAAAAAAEARLARHAQRSVGTRAPTSAAAARTSTAAAAPAGPRVLGNAAAGSAEQRVQACAARLVGRPLAVDTLITSLSKVLDHPHEEKYRKVNISNKAFQERVASAPGGIDFMYAVGFEPVHGHLLLQVHASTNQPAPPRVLTSHRAFLPRKECASSHTRICWLRPTRSGAHH